MVDIIVRRNGGTRPGDDIIDPLIATDAVAVQRGRNELDERARAFTPVTATIINRTGLLPGQLAEVNDSYQGRSYRAKIKGVRLNRQGGKGRATLVMDKVSEFQ